MSSIKNSVERVFTSKDIKKSFMTTFKRIVRCKPTITALATQSTVGNAAEAIVKADSTSMILHTSSMMTGTSCVVHQFAFKLIPLKKGLDESESVGTVKHFSGTASSGSEVDGAGSAWRDIILHDPFPDVAREARLMEYALIVEKVDAYVREDDIDAPVKVEEIQEAALKSQRTQP